MILGWLSSNQSDISEVKRTNIGVKKTGKIAKPIPTPEFVLMPRNTISSGQVSHPITFASFIEACHLSNKTNISSLSKHFFNCICQSALLVSSRSLKKTVSGWETLTFEVCFPVYLCQCSVAHHVCQSIWGKQNNCKIVCLLKMWNCL